MFTVLGAIAAVGGAIPLIKKSTEGQDENAAAARPAQPPVDPIAAVLQAAKTLSQSLPSALTGHALSKATNPPSFLVPSHTPSPPVSDLQVLAAALTAARKHGLNRWGCQSVFVRKGGGLDVGIWVGPIDDDDDVAGAVVDRLTGGKAGHVQASMMISLPESTQSDPAFVKAVHCALAGLTVFSLPEKDGKQAFFLAGRNTLTNNWLAIAGASGSNAQPEAETMNESTETAAPQEEDKVAPEKSGASRRKGRKRRKRQKKNADSRVKHGLISDAHEQGNKDIKRREVI